MLSFFLTQNFDKIEPTPNIMIASIGKTRPAKQQKIITSCVTFKGKIKLKKYPEENQTHNGKKTLESSNGLEAIVAALAFETKNSSNESLFAEEKPKAKKRNEPAFHRMGNRTRQNRENTCQSGLL